VEVIARNSTFQYKNQNPDIRDVGRDLGAEYVIEGSVRPLGERIRVTVQVIDARTGVHVWAEKYDRPLADFFNIQDEVSLGVAAAVGDAVFRNEYSEINQSRTENLNAWSLTSQAEVGFNHAPMNDEIGISKARQAVELDPEYALAHAVLGRGLSFYSLNNRDPAVAKEAEAEARLALMLQPDDPKVNAFLAMTLLLTGQPVEALPYAKRVTKISPSYAEGLSYYADILTHNGRAQEALPYLDKAIRLTPNAPQLGTYHLLRGEALMHDGNFIDAEASLLTANRSFQGKHQMLLRYLAGTQLRLGKTDEARASLKAADDFSDRTLREEQAAVEFISADGGGEYFKAIWADLEKVSASNSP
jgi:adenylate cyclase